MPLTVRSTPPASQPTYAARKVRTSDRAHGAATWTEFDTAMDITLTAKAGDWVEVGTSALWSTEAVNGLLDVVSVVAAAWANSWGADASATAPAFATHYGILAWNGQPSQYGPIGGSIYRKLVAGDIESGQVKLRLLMRCDGATVKTLLGSADVPVVFWARNHG